MDFQVSPLEGVGPIKFGMSRDEVRLHFDASPNSFKRTPQDTFPCDYYESEGVFFYYDERGNLEAAEFASPAQPYIANLKLIGLSLGAAIVALSSLDKDVEREADGAIAHGLGVSIYAPLAKDDASAPVESLLAFRPGYYD